MNDELNNKTAKSLRVLHEVMLSSLPVIGENCNFMINRMEECKWIADRKETLESLTIDTLAIANRIGDNFNEILRNVIEKEMLPVILLRGLKEGVLELDAQLSKFNELVCVLNQDRKTDPEMNSAWFLVTESVTNMLNITGEISDVIYPFFQLVAEGLESEFPSGSDASGC